MKKLLAIMVLGLLWSGNAYSGVVELKKCSVGDNKFNPKQVINLSSIAVYPNKDGIFYETSEIRPSANNDGLYGLSKFIGENILDFKCAKSNIVKLRLAQV